MAAACPVPYDGLKEMLQSAVQSVQWTYIIFWQFCPQQSVLVWGDGYYNGVIKTRKTVQAVEVGTEEAVLSRSEQLKELYDSLASGDQQLTENQVQATIRRPSVALSPEDLTESEWFYLMCISFTFPPGVGLVGEAYAKQQHKWLAGANEADSNVFTRAILAKSARIQTVICIPLLNGVVELGTTKKVAETNEFVQHVKLFFMIHNGSPCLPPPKPALSAHSSNTTLSSHQIPTTIKPLNNTYSMDEYVENEDEDQDIDDDDQADGVEYKGGDEDENGSDFVAETCYISGFQEPHEQDENAIIKANELLQLDMSEDVRFGSPDGDEDNSNNFDSRVNLLPTSQDSYRAESTDDLKLHNPSNIQLQTSEELATDEDSHYSHTVSFILHNQLTRWSDSVTPSRQISLSSIQSSFATWTSHHHQSHRLPARKSYNSQRLLKYVLFTVPFLHSNSTSIDGDASESVASRLRKTTSHEELSANHVLAERRRREKLNERFIILRLLVPLVTKTDKASILGDTIEYVKQLRKKIQDLEARARGDAVDSVKVAEKRKIRVLEGGNGGGVMVAKAVQVEVSIIENDALLELQCTDKEGLLLDVMKKLRELGLEITTVQSCVKGGTCTAEMRAKVKGNNRKKASITQVKKAINQIINPL